MGGKKNKKQQQQQQQQQQQPQQQQQKVKNNNLSNIPCDHDHDHDHDHQHQHQHSHEDQCCGHDHSHNQQQQQQQQLMPQAQMLNELTQGLQSLNGGGGSLMDSLNMLPKLSKLLGNMTGGVEIKPDDPLPDFTQFEQAKETLDIQIEDFQMTVELVKNKQFDKLQKPQKQKQTTKLTKKQQQIKDKNNQTIKSNIDYLDSIQKELKKYGKEPLCAGLSKIIDLGTKSISEDIQYYQKQLEV